MEKFIRIDEKGHWKGKEHISSIGGFAGECYCEYECTCNGNWEQGVSCYTLKNVAEGIENLREY